MPVCIFDKLGNLILKFEFLFVSSLLEVEAENTMSVVDETKSIHPSMTVLATLQIVFSETINGISINGILFIKYLKIL